MKLTLLGRNELCPCGSGKKYKRCCLNKDEKTDNVIEELFVLSKGEVFYPKGINSPFSE